MNIFIKIQDNPKKFQKFELDNEIYYSLLSKIIGLDIEEIRDRENGKVIDIQYSNFKSGFEYKIRETLQMIYSDEYKNILKHE